MLVFIIFLIVFGLIDSYTGSNILPIYVIICAILFSIYFIVKRLNKNKEEKQIQSYIDDASKAELNRITAKLREDLINIYTIFGYSPTNEQLNQIVTDITTSTISKSDDEIFEKMISYIPKTIPEPNSYEYNLFVSINIDKIVDKYIPKKWQSDIHIAANEFTNISEDELLNIVHKQKLMYPQNDIHLYRFNYAYFAYEAIYNSMQTVVIDDDDFTEEVRNIILQKILAGAREEGYHLV